MAAIEGRGQPKIGEKEFLSVAERFGLSKSVLRKIKEALREEDWESGPFLANYYSDLKETKVQAFERKARDFFGTPFSLAVNSGTSALHAAFVAVGVGPGTEVILPAIGFFATAAAVVAAKGVPVFCDVNESLAMDPNKIERLITRRTVAVAPTCVMGSVPDMDPILNVARRHRIHVVEDCAQSCGGRYKGKLVGTLGDVGCFSISAYKIVGGGEGGLLLAKDKSLWERASQLVECGGLWRPDRFAPPRYDGELFCGNNYRMSELEAAVDVIQIDKIQSTVSRFQRVKHRILERLHSYREITPQLLNDPEGEVGYRICFFPETLDLGEKIVEALQAEGVPCGTRGNHGAPDWHCYGFMYPILLQGTPTPVNCPFHCPIYLSKGGEATYARGDCPVADDLFDRVVAVHLNQWHTVKDCKNIAAGINKVLDAFCGRTKDPAKGWLRSCLS